MGVYSHYAAGETTVVNYSSKNHIIEIGNLQDSSYSYDYHGNYL